MKTRQKKFNPSCGVKKLLKTEVFIELFWPYLVRFMRLDSHQAENYLDVDKI